MYSCVKNSDEEILVLNNVDEVVGALTVRYDGEIALLDIVKIPLADELASDGNPVEEYFKFLNCIEKDVLFLVRSEHEEINKVAWGSFSEKMNLENVPKRKKVSAKR